MINNHDFKKSRRSLVLVFLDLSFVIFLSAFLSISSACSFFSLFYVNDINKNSCVIYKLPIVNSDVFKFTFIYSDLLLFFYNPKFNCSESSSSSFSVEVLYIVSFMVAFY